MERRNRRLHLDSNIIGYAFGTKIEALLMYSQASVPSVVEPVHLFTGAWFSPDSYH